MANPARPGQRVGARKSVRPKKTRRPGKVRRARKEEASSERSAAEGWVAVKHYGETWEFEHYEKESMKASGVYL